MRPNPEDYAFVTNFSPLPMAKAVAGLRSKMKSALISSVISLLITGFIYWRNRPVEGVFKWVLIAFLVLAVARPIITAIRLWRANRILNRIEMGPALRVDPLGLVLSLDTGFERVEWDRINEVGSKQRHKLPGHELVIGFTDTKKKWRVPFAFLDVMPGSIDSAFRAHTLGNVTLDLSKLDRVW